MSEVIVVRLMFGDEVIGRCVEETDEQIVLEKVFQNAYLPSSEDGVPSLAMIPYQQHTEAYDRLPIERRAVAYVTKPVSQLLEYYKKQSSPIITSDIVAG